MPPNGWKWIVLVAIIVPSTLLGGYFHVVPGEVVSAVLAGVLGLFARSPMQNGGAINGTISLPPAPVSSRPSLPSITNEAEKKP